VASIVEGHVELRSSLRLLHGDAGADDRIVKFNIDTGQIDPDTTPLFTSKKNSFQPRVSSTYAVSDKTVLRGGFGIFVGPGQTEDQIQPIRSRTHQHHRHERGVPPLSRQRGRDSRELHTNPNNRSYQPRAYANDYTLPERVYQYTASIQQELPGGTAATIAYVGSQGRNLFLRSVSNQIIGVLPSGTAPPRVRHHHVRERSPFRTEPRGRRTPRKPVPGSTAASKQSPYAEIDYKTSGGHDSYNALQISLQKRALRGLALNGSTRSVAAREHRRIRTRRRRQQQRPHAGSVRFRGRLQQLRRPPHLQHQRALLGARPGCMGGWLGDWRHLQRPQWSSRFPCSSRVPTSSL
jgi:hypothetical protein